MKSRHAHSLSVVYATYNEEARLAESLRSIADLADEIIVVDGSSSDRTPAIAQEFGARVISTTNKPIFHINKQMAMDAAKGDWTLQMDADEVVDEEMRRDIRRVLAIEDMRSLPAAYWLRRRNWFFGRFMTKGGQYPDPVIRFYQTGKAHLPMKTVHEQMEVQGEVGWLQGHLLHYNSPTFADYLRKSNAYTSLSAQEWYDAGVRPGLGSLLYYMLWMPCKTFFLLLIRHKGFLDGMAGWLFAFFSGWHYVIAYIKLYEKCLSGKGC